MKLPIRSPKSTSRLFGAGVGAFKAAIYGVRLVWNRMLKSIDAATAETDEWPKGETSGRRMADGRNQNHPAQPAHRPPDRKTAAPAFAAGRRPAWFVLCAGLLVLTRTASPAQTGHIQHSFVVEAPADFRLSAPDKLTQLRSFPLRPVRSIDAANAPLHAVTWYKLTINLPQTASEDLVYLFLRAAHQRELTAYLVGEGGLVREASSGFRLAAGFDYGLSDLTLNLPRTVGPTADVYIRSVPVSPFPMTPAVLRLEEIQGKANVTTGFIWLYYGGALFLVLFQSIWWYHLRDPASRDYVMLSIGMMLSSLARYGIVDRAVALPFGVSLSDWLPHLMLLNTLLAMRLHLSFYDLAKTLPGAARILRGLLIFIVLLLGAGIFLPPTEFFRFALVGQLLAIITGLPIEIMAVRRGLPGAWMALLGWTGMYVMLFILNLSGIGLLPKSSHMQLLPLIGMLWEMGMNTLGLSRKFDLVSRASHEAEKQEVERRSLERLVRVLCHDISNPLTVIIMNSGLYRTGDSTTPTPKIFVHMQRIAKAATTIGEIIESVRSMEQLRLNDGKVELAPTNLAATIDEAEDIFREKLAEKSLRLVKSLPDNLPLVMAEANMLKSSILANILSNAIKFSGAGSKIELSARLSDRHVTLSVRDQGVGIPQELMEEFNRCGLIRSRPGTFDEQGTGLGLQLIHEFTAAMGGRMRLICSTDQTSGGAAGTIVEIILPVAPSGA